MSRASWRRGRDALRGACGDDGNRTNEGHEQKHAGCLDGEEMPAEEFTAQPGHVVGRERIDGGGGLRRDRGCRAACDRGGLRGRIAAGGRPGREPADEEREQAEQDGPRHGGEQGLVRDPVVGGHPGGLGEHQNEQEHHEDRSGIDDDRGHAQKLGPEHEQHSRHAS